MYTQKIDKALKEMGDKTKLKADSIEVLKDGKTAINLSQNIIIFLETDKNKNVKKHH